MYYNTKTAAIRFVLFCTYDFSRYAFKSFKKKETPTQLLVVITLMMMMMMMLKVVFPNETVLKRNECVCLSHHSMLSFRFVTRDKSQIDIAIFLRFRFVSIFITHKL